MSNKERAREYREQLEESRRLKKDKEGWLKAKTIPRPICEDVGTVFQVLASVDYNSFISHVLSKEWRGMFASTATTGCYFEA